MRRIVYSSGFALMVLTGSAQAQQQQPASTANDSSRAALQAQEARTPTLLERLTPPAPASSEAAPRWRADEQKNTTRSALQPAMPAIRGESVALMIAGGALFVAGILTGDGAGALLMVGGAAVGAYGLYLHYR